MNCSQTVFQIVGKLTNYVLLTNNAIKLEHNHILVGKEENACIVKQEIEGILFLFYPPIQVLQ
jgi:hypothetical protein